MKNRVLVAFVALLITAVFAQNKAVCVECMKKMRQAEEAMALIQKGFLYNHKYVVANGVNTLKDALGHAEAFVHESKKRGGDVDMKLAKAEAQEIGKLADNILKKFEAKDINGAMKDYVAVLNRCTACHATTRGW